MKKSLLILFVLGFLSITNTVKAQQVEIREASVTIDKVSQSAVVADFKYSAKVLKKVLEKRFEEASLTKSRKASNKFRKFEGVVWTNVSPDKMDYYYKVSGKKKKATLEILASKGYDNFINGQTNPDAFQNIKNFIASLEADVIRFNLNELVMAKEKAIKHAEKELKDKKEEVSKTEKKLEKAKKEESEQNDVLGKLKNDLDNLNAQK